MKRLLLFVFAWLILIANVQSQVNLYNFASSSGSYTSITGGTLLISGTSSMDSWASSAQTIPSFTFNGVPYTTAYVTSNGILTLGGSAPSAYTTTGISTTTGSGFAICPFSADLDRATTTTATEIRWETVGNEVIFQWQQVKRYSATENFDFQVRLNTSNNEIIFVYRLNSGPGTSTSYQPQVGIRTSTSDYKNRLVASGTENWDSSLPGAANTSTCRFTGTSPAKNFTTGLTYTWTPPNPCTGTPNPGNTVSSVNPACSGITFLLSLQNITTGTGVTYQWQSSPDNLTYTDISGATASTYSATQTVSTWYRCNVTCSGNTGTSTPVQVNMVNTNYSSLPYSQGFEDTWVNGCNTKDIPSDKWKNTPPTGNNSWRRDDDGTSAGWTSTSGSYSPSGASGSAHSARFHSYNASSGLQGLLDLYLDCGSGSSWQLTFDMINTSGTDVLAVLLSTDGGSNFNQIGSNYGVLGSWTNNLLNFTSNSATTVLRFRATSDYGATDIGLDNVNVQAPPSCPAPTALTATGITNSSANIGWTAGGSETAWEYVYGVSPVAAPSGSGTATTNNPTSLSGLSGNTTYQFYVRANCGSGSFSSWAGPYTFKTLCNPISSISENFDGVTVPALPDCWSKYISPSWSAQTVTTVTTSPNSSPNVVQIYSSGATSSSDAPLLISPKLTNVGAGTYQLRFFAKGASTNLSVIIGTMSDPTNAATFTAFTTVTGLSTSSYTEKIVSFASYSGSDNYIAFKHPLTTTYSYIYIDDVNWEPLPTCPKPTALTTTGITPSSANIGWTAGGSETAWEYVYGVSPLAAPSGSGTPTSNNPTALSGLTANTTYQFYVRADCGSGNFSTWSGPYSFYTGYCVPTGSTTYYLNNVVTTGGVTNISNSTGASTGGYGNYSATISCSNYVGTSTSISLSSSASDDYYYCWIDWNNDLDFGDAGETIFATTSYSAGYTGTINIPSGTMVGNYRMRVANSYSGAITSCGPASSGEYEDYTFTVTNPPSCPAPGSLSVTNLTSVSADLGWTAGSTETAWEYVYGVSPLAAPSGSGTPTTSNPTSISGLTAQTAYQFYVRANCGSEFSTWAGPYSFTTPPANDECTGAINVTVNSDNTCTVFTSGSTLGATQSSAGCAGTADDDVWFKFRASYPTHLIDILNIVAVSGTSTDMMHQVYSGTCGNLTSLVCSDPNSSTVTGLTIGQTYYVRVYSYYSTSRNSFDICVKLPLCSTPTGLSATNQTPNGATLNWTENGGATSWDLYIVSSGSPAPDGSTTPTVDNTSTKPYVWTGGTSNTPYDWYARADCGASGGSGQSAWSTVGTFTTSSDEAVDWCNLQWPGSGAIEVGGTYDVYAQAYEPGVTPGAGAGAGITAWIGYSTSDTDPSTWTNWVAATFNTDVSNNDEYKATLGAGMAPGTYYYASRFKLNSGPYKYGGYSASGGGFWNGTTYMSGILTVNHVNGDLCTNAISLPIGEVCTNTQGTNANASPSGELPIPTCSSFGNGTDNWYSIVVPITGSVTVEMSSAGGPTDWGMSIYSGACGSLTQVACDDDSGEGAFPKISLTGQTPGNTLYVRVFEYGNNATGAFNICAKKDCPATMTVLPASATSTSSTGSCVDGNGWTHYLDNSNNLLLSLKLGSSGAVINGITVDPDGGTDAVYVLNDADGFPQVGGSSGAAFMRRKWDVNATTQPSSDVTVRHYYTIDEYNAVNSQITGNGGLALSSQNQLNFYKVITPGMDPFNIGPGGIAIGDIALIINGATAGINTWVAGTATGGFYAEYLVAGFSGGGGGGASNGKLLPLDLVSFIGIPDKDVNILNWKTVNEVNTEKFIVERSIDGNKWEYVADINASGNSKAERSYTATDEKPYSLSYYRLKMMDRDGRYSYSKNISIERKDNTFRLYSVSPNPNNGNFAVTFNSIGSGKTNLVVVNSLGMKVYSKSVDTKAGTNNEFLGIDNLTDGIYTLILEQNGQIVTQRIAINK